MMKIEVVNPKQYSKYVTNNVAKKVAASIETGTHQVKGSELARKTDGLILYALEKAYEGEYVYEELTDCLSLTYNTIQPMFNEFRDKSDMQDEKNLKKKFHKIHVLNHLSWKIRDFEKSIEHTVMKTLTTKFEGVEKVRKVCKRAASDTKYYSGTLMGHTDLETSLPLVVTHANDLDTTELYYLLTPARLAKDLLQGIITPTEMDEIISAISIATPDSQPHRRAYFSYRKLGGAVMAHPEIVRDATSGKHLLVKNLGTALVHSLIKHGVATGQIGIHEDTLVAVTKCIANYTGENYSKLKKALLEEMTGQGIERYITFRERMKAHQTEQQAQDAGLRLCAITGSTIFSK